MKTSPLRRGLALFLCVQPVFWTSNVALAQTLRAPGGSSPFAPGRSDSGERRPGDGGDAPAPPFPEPRFGVAPDPAAQGEGSQPAFELPPVDEPLDPETYVCGPGDRLQLNFWGIQNFRLLVPIDLEGRAFVPKVGHFDLDGKTLAEARQMMRSSVARLFPKLGFDVSLAVPRTFRVQVVADVKSPGSYPARAIDRVAAVIERAGGLGPNASTRRIELRRRDGSVLNADLLLYQLSGDVKHNPHVLDGDVVRVPYEELAASITGAVNRPGRYELTGTKDLSELVTLAGGLAPAVTQQLPLRLVRVQADDRQDLTLVELGADRRLPQLPLKHEDTVHIPGYGEIQQSVMVMGAFTGAAPPPATPAASARPGSAPTAAPPDESAATKRLPFVKGDTVRTLIERVGGVGPLADLSSSYILRAGKSVPVDLHALVMLRDLEADRPVELGDTLVIPFKRQSVLVQGAVFAPGAYPYNPNYGIDQYLSLAGGPNRFGKSVKSVRVIGPSGETRGYSRDLEIEPGSQLVIPEKSFSSPEIVQIVISVASVLISGVAVMLAARN